MTLFRINRNNFVALIELRPNVPEEIMAVEWIAEGSNVFNAFVPFYANITKTPDYLARTDAEVTTDNFSWANRLIGALADNHWSMCNSHIERYQNSVHSKGHRFINEFDRQFINARPENVQKALEENNEEIAAMAKEETAAVLDKVLYEASMEMKNGFSRSDA